MVSGKKIVFGKLDLRYSYLFWYQTFHQCQAIYASCNESVSMETWKVLINEKIEWFYAQSCFIFWLALCIWTYCYWNEIVKRTEPISWIFKKDIFIQFLCEYLTYFECRLSQHASLMFKLEFPRLFNLRLHDFLLCYKSQRHDQTIRPRFWRQ